MDGSDADSSKPRKRRPSLAEDAVEIGLEEAVVRSRSLLQDASVAFELIDDVEIKRQKLHDTLESKVEDVKKHTSLKSRQKAANDFVAQVADTVNELQNLNSLTVEVAQQGYDAYDKAIQEIDERIRLLKQHVTPIALPEAAPPAPPSKRRGRKGKGQEPLYCFCHGVASGEMICCDNEDCPIEWFHFRCLDAAGFTPPPGRWLCPHCRHVTSA